MVGASMMRRLFILLLLLPVYAWAAAPQTMYHNGDVGSSTSPLPGVATSHCSANTGWYPTRQGAADACSAILPDSVKGSTYTFYKTGLPIQASSTVYNQYYTCTLDSGGTCTTRYTYINTYSATLCLDGSLPDTSLPLEEQCDDPPPPTCEEKISDTTTHLMVKPQDVYAGKWFDVDGCVAYASMAGSQCLLDVNGVTWCSSTMQFTGQTAADMVEQPADTGGDVPTDIPPTQSSVGFGETVTTTPEVVTTNPDGSTTTEQTTAENQTTTPGTTIENTSIGTKITEYTDGTNNQKATTKVKTTYPDGSATETETTTVTKQTSPSVVIDIHYDGDITTTYNNGGTTSGTTTRTTTTGADGSVTTTTESDGTSAEDAEKEGTCSGLPDLVCNFIDWMKDPGGLDEEPPTVPMVESTEPDPYYLGLPSDSSCPSGPTVNTSFGSYIISMQPLCDLAVMIRGFVIAMAYLMGAFIVLGARR